MKRVLTIIRVMEPTRIIRLAERVYLLIGTMHGEMTVVYDTRYWKPTHVLLKPKSVGDSNHLARFALDPVSATYDMCTHICRVWMDLGEIKGDWWYQQPVTIEGERGFPRPLPDLGDIFGDTHRSKQNKRKLKKTALVSA